MSKVSKKFPRKISRDVYQEVTDRIVDALEAGVAPWVKPWASIGVPHNAASGHVYQGINQVLLGMTSFKRSGWMTYNQASNLGGHVRRGESGTQIVLFKPFAVKEKNAKGEEVTKNLVSIRAFTVFNIDQIDELPAKFYATESKPETAAEVNECAEVLMGRAKIIHGGDHAFFSPFHDLIQLPNKDQFKSAADYYATALHELTHWTGHKSRLARDFSGRFGDESYAFEELIAELGAAFNCSHCGIDGQLQHPAYIANWLKVLKNDKKAIFTASSAARKASEYLVGDIDPADADDEAAAVQDEQEAIAA